MDHAASEGCADRSALTIVLGVTIAEAAPAAGTNDARLTGLRLYHAGKFQEAIPYFDQVLALTSATSRS